MNYFCFSIYTTEILEAQKIIKDAQYNIWKKSMSNDWLYADDRRTFSVAEFYTQLRWAQRIEGPIQSTKETMTSIYDLFKVAGTGKKKILVEG